MEFKQLVDELDWKQQLVLLRLCDLLFQHDNRGWALPSLSDVVDGDKIASARPSRADTVWLALVQSHLDEILRRFSLRVHLSGAATLENASSGVALTRADIVLLGKTIEDKLADPATLRDRLATIATEAYHRSLALLRTMCNYLPDVENAMAQFPIQVTEPCIMDDLAPYTVTYEAMYDGIRIPNWTQWNEAEIKFVFDNTPPERRHMGRFWIGRAVTIATAIGHESTHVAQHLAKQEMTLQAAEHDAALVTLIYGVAIADREWPWPGFQIEILDQTRHYIKQLPGKSFYERVWGSAAQAHYKAWRDSFGTGNQGNLWFVKERPADADETHYLAPSPGAFPCYRTESTFKWMLGTELLARVIQYADSLPGSAKFDAALKRVLAAALSSALRNRTGRCDAAMPPIESDADLRNSAPEEAMRLMISLFEIN